MKYGNWLKLQYDKLDEKDLFETCIVPVKSLESLLENVEGLESYVRYLTGNNEYLSNAMNYYRILYDELKVQNGGIANKLETKENENGSQNP